MLPLDEFPNILTAQDIADYLRVGRKRVYELLQLSPRYGGIPAFSVGRSKRVDKREFAKWVEAQKKQGAS
jgi:excisionase family DNA binding protein